VSSVVGHGRFALSFIAALAAFACDRGDAPSAPAASNATPAAAQSDVTIRRYAGILPCADCAGLHTDLRLFSDPGSDQATRYEIAETYIGARDGDRAFENSGRWGVLRGTPADADATVYQLDIDKPGRARNFLRVGDGELRALDRQQNEIASPFPLVLRRLGPDANAFVTLTEREAGAPQRVELGQTIIVRLESNRTTGYRWTVASADGAVLSSLGDPFYTTPQGAVGASGTESWWFRVVNTGAQRVTLEYRRSFESGVPASRTVSYDVEAAGAR
jgi:predicted secreted protein